MTKAFAELFASCAERPISARELFVTHYLVQLESQNVHNRGVPMADISLDSWHLVGQQFEGKYSQLSKSAEDDFTRLS